MSADFKAKLFSQPRKVHSEFVLSVGDESITVQVMELSAREMSRMLDAAIQAGELKAQTMHPVSMTKGALANARFVVAAVFHEGKPLFTDADRDALTGMPQFADLFHACQKAVTKSVQGEIEEAAKN